MSKPVPESSIARRACCIALALISTVSIGAFGAEGGAAEGERGTVEAPQVLYSKLDPAEYSDPVWVAASELVEGDSAPAWQLLGTRAAETWASKEPTLRQDAALKGRVAAVPEEEDCGVMHNRLTWSSGAQRARGGLAPFFDTATGVFAGTVVGHTPGFYLGALATVLTIDVSETLRGLSETEVPPYLHAVYPQARFALDGRIYCARHETGPGLPPVGSNVVVLTHHPAADEQGVLFKVSVDEVLGVTPEGAVLVPEALEAETPFAEVTSWEELLAAVRSLTEDPEGSGKPELSEKGGRR